MVIKAAGHLPTKPAAQSAGRALLAVNSTVSGWISVMGRCHHLTATAVGNGISVQARQAKRIA